MNASAFRSRFIILIPVLLGALLMQSGCASKTAAIKVEPTMMAQSVDFTSPATIEGNAKPVYVLPVFSTGWEKATVDAKTGAWKSGRYTAHVVADGYWTTQEEAEISGKPYIIVGKSGVETVAGGTQLAEIGRANTGGAELNVADLARRVDQLETQRQAPPPSPDDPDANAQLAARIQALATASLPGRGGPVDVTMDQGGYEPKVSVPFDDSQLDPSASWDVVIPRQQGRDQFSVDVPGRDGSKNKINVRYMEDGSAAIVTYGTQTKRVRLKTPYEKIRVRIQ